MKRVIAFFAWLLLGGMGVVSAQAATNTVTVSGAYDFSVNNACSATVTSGCLKQFNVYDTTSGTAVLLGSVAAPAGATSATSAVSGSFTIPALKAGPRTFIITAQMADGTESDPKASAVISQTVRPGVPINLGLTAS